MGDFFSSPQQRASQSLYDAAKSGKPIGADFADQSYRSGINNIEAQTSNRIGGLAGDVLSRTASEGFTPGGATEGIISKGTQGVLAGEQQAEGQLTQAHMQQIMSMLMEQLQLGLKGLPSSSPAGDLLGGLTTLGNVATGAGGLISAIK